MAMNDPTLPPPEYPPAAGAGAPVTPCADVLATQNHDVIRRWADLRQAHPAADHAAGTGAVTLAARDGDCGIRFNFSDVGSFRPITWDEWFRSFDEHELTFVYDNATVQRDSYRILKRPDWNDIVR